MDWLVAENVLLDPKNHAIIHSGQQHTTVLSDKDNGTILQEFKILIPDDRKQTTTITDFLHRIDTGDAAPIVARDYRRSPQEQETIDVEVKTLLSKGVIRHSASS